MTITIGIMAAITIETAAMINAVTIAMIGTGTPMTAATMTAGETTIARTSALWERACSLLPPLN
jgi:hypothetical protein